MNSRGLLGSLASMLALVGLNRGSPAEGRASAGDDPAPRRGARAPAAQGRRLAAEAMDRAERKRARVAITRRGLRVVVGPRATEASS